MRDLASERPAEFPKVILPAEKKLLEEILETSLGDSRKKPAAKKATTPRKASGTKAAAKKTTPKPAEKPAGKPRKPSPRAPF
jgi:hypothetical protein